MEKKKFYIIDGHALCYRAYYAFINNPLYNSKGQNTSAIFGFARMFLRLIEEQAPDYLAVAFDPPKKSFRFDIYKEYKANRAKMPDDLKSQIEEIKNLVATLDIPVLINNKYEADDVLGTIANNYAADDLEVVLVTGDKDAYQLIEDNVSIYANTKGISEHIIYDANKVKEKLGITPDQVIDYMAMVGDTSDNVPGIKGIGAKTAEKLISEYGSLDNIYKNIDQIKGKLKEKIENGKEDAYLSKDLVTIRQNIDLNFAIDEAAFKGFDNEKAGSYFIDLEMKTIASEYFSMVDDDTPVVKNKETNYQVIKNKKDLEKAIKEIKKVKLISIDTETTSVNAVDADIVGISISIEEYQGWYIPLQNISLFSDNSVEIDKNEALKILKPVIEDEAIKKVGQNIKYDIIIFANEGINLKGLYFDTMIASYLLSPNDRRHNMDDMAMFYLNYKTVTYKELVGTGKKALAITDVPLEDLANYAIEDSDITLRLYNILKKKIIDEKLDKIFNEIELPLIPVLVQMEMDGVKIDKNYFAKLGMDNDKQLQQIEKNIYDLAEEEFNINSTKELSRILFEKLALKPVKKTKTGFSTDITVLEALKGEHDIIENLISYRTLNKLKTTYIDTLPKLISENTGRIHSSYNQTIAATGRLSSTDPNLQNIPIKGEVRSQIRKGFVAENNSSLMSADYSQIELRLAAHFANDENMLKAYKEGIDIHAMTAANVFGVDIDNISREMRNHAKVVNFSVIYGVSPFGLSKQADISIKEAAEFIDKYFESYPGVKTYFDKMTEFAKEHKYVETIKGRKRPVPEIDSKVSFRREGAERVAVNSPIQGTSADMIKIAMINIEKEFKEKNLKTKMIMQVHDELVFEVPEDEKEIVEKIVKDKMENAIDLKVPIVVDVGWGSNWEEAH